MTAGDPYIMLSNISNWAAYKATTNVDLSLNQISNATALNVGRVSTAPLTPANAGISGMQLWLDAADRATVNVSGSYVTQWRDKSGFGYHAVGNTNSGRYSSNGLNSLPTIQITTSSNMRAPVAAFSFSTAITLFVVFQKTGAVPTSNTIVTRTIGSAPAPFDMYNNTGFIGNGGRYGGITAIVANTTPTLWNVSLSSGSANWWYEWVNGTGYAYSFLSGGSPGYYDNGSNIFIGTRGDGATGMNGNISEIIAYNIGLSTTQRQQIEGYLAWKWGMVSSLPAGHPYLSAPPMTTPAAVNTFGTITTDPNNNLYLSSTSNVILDATSNIRLTRPTETRWITSNVSGTSLTLTNSDFSTVYRLTNTGFNLLTVPTLSRAETGAFWTLSNATASAFSMTISGGVNVSGSYSFGASNWMQLYWDGSSNYITTTGDPGNWANYKAITNVDICGNQVNNVATLNVARFGSIPLTPSNAGITGLQLWLDGADSSTITLSGPSNVASWRDKSPNAFTVSSNASTPPIVNSTLINGRNIVTFPPSSSSLGVTMAVPNSGTRSVFYVVRVSSSGSGLVAPINSPTAYAIQSYFTPNATSTSFQAVDMNGIDSTCAFTYTGGSTQDTVFMLGAVAQTAGTINGNTQTLTRTAAANFFTGSTGYTIGNSGTRTLEMAEFLLFNTNLNTTQRQQIEGYLAWKWGLQSSLPVSHPYYAAAPNLASSALNTLATLTTDVNSNVLLSATSNIRLTQPTEWHYITTDTSASSLALSSNNAGTLYNVTSNALSLITAPALNLGDRGMWWQFSNSTTSNLAFTVSGFTGLPSSNYTLMPYAAATFYWNGTANRVMAPYTGIVNVIETSGTSLTLASSNYNSMFYLTNGGFNAVTLPASTAVVDGGNYWSLRNATANYLSITLTNTLSLTSPLVIPPSNTTTLAISRVTSNTILLF